MQRLLVVLIVVMLVTVNVAAQKAGEDAVADVPGVSVTCENGTTFNNGVEVTVIQMRSGYTYQATVLGMNGFDPVLAVLDEEGNGICTDDSVDAAEYSAYLPTTDLVDVSVLNSQVFFENTATDAFANISLVVGGYGDQPGEFVLILEGMYVDPNYDGMGDPFSVYVTSDMVLSGVPLTVYAIADFPPSGGSWLDPLMQLVNITDAGYEDVYDSSDNLVYCDDSGSETLCWSGAIEMDLDGNEIYDDYYVTIDNGETLLPVGGLDSILTIPLGEEDASGYYTFVTTSYNQSSSGYYVMVFHIGNGELEDK